MIINQFLTRHFSPEEKSRESAHIRSFKMTEQTSKKISLNELKNFGKSILVRHGMSEADAEICAKILADTDSYGINSHGTKNLKGYVDKMALGKLDPKAEPETVREFGAIAAIDAHDCMGYVAGYKATRKAIELARKFGIGFVTVKNSCHFGAAFNYANMVAEAGFFGLVCSNTDPNMAVPGGRTMVIGNNPLAFALPVRGMHPVILDIALSQVAALKINKAKVYGQKIPEGWMVDPDGRPTTDPNWYQNGGALLPMSAHKGYGLSMMVEALTSIASGGLLVRDVNSWCFKMDSYNRASHAFIAVNMEAINDRAQEKSLDYVNYILNSPKAAGTDEILCPGMIEWRKHDSAIKDGLVLPYDVVDSLESIAVQEGQKLNWLL